MRTNRALLALAMGLAIATTQQRADATAEPTVREPSDFARRRQKDAEAKRAHKARKRGGFA